MNFTDLQAELGRVQLKRFREFEARRLEVAKLFAKGLQKLEVEMQSNLLSPLHSRHLFPILIPRSRSSISRNELMASLKEEQVGAAVHYAP